MFFKPNFVLAADNPEPAQFTDLETLFSGILNVALTVAIIAVFLMLLLGGFKYLTSGGDPKGNESAKNIITYAILGLLLMIGAWFILQLIKTFTGVEVTKFSILFG